MGKKVKKVVPIVLILIFCFVLFSGCDKEKGKDLNDYPLIVSFVDVGQGDGILVECEGNVLVIDGGEVDSVFRFNNYLKQRGIDKIDCYIATHPHSDHIGAIPAIMSMHETSLFMMPEFSELNIPTTKTYENMLNAITASECTVNLPKPGETYQIGNAKLEFYAPIFETDNYNNMSLVFRLTYGNTSFLFVGDAEKDSERAILESGADISADVLKVGHHGSSSSSSSAFIKAVSPDIAVISCGAGNDFGHPHDETVMLFESLDIPLFRTDLNGTVRIYSDGNAVVTE